MSKHVDTSKYKACITAAAGTVYYGTVHWPTVVCGEGVCECWYDHLSVVLLCVLYSAQDWELNYACGYGRLEDAQSAINKGADPNWKDEVSLQLFNSQCCVSSVVSEHVVV